MLRWLLAFPNISFSFGPGRALSDNFQCDEIGLTAKTMRLFVIFLLGLASSLGYSHGSESSYVIDKKFKVVDTGLLAPGFSYAGSGTVWINDRLILTSVKKDAKQDKLESYEINVFDVEEGQIKNIFDANRVICFDSVLGRGLLSKNGKLTDIYTQDSKIFVLTDTDQNDQCAEIVKIPDRLIFRLRKGQGYIDFGRAGGGAPEAVLYSPGMPAKPLGLKGRDFSGAEYIYFLDKYFLYPYDWRLEGEADKNYFLMAPDGSLATIAYPARLANVLGHFDKLFVSKIGLVATRFGNNSNSGIYILKEDVALRVYKASGENPAKIFVSPSGCHIAFYSREDFLAIHGKNTIKFIDLCGEGI